MEQLAIELPLILPTNVALAVMAGLTIRYVWATRRGLFSKIKVQSFDPSASPMLAQKKIRYGLDSGLSFDYMVPER